MKNKFSKSLLFGVLFGIVGLVLGVFLVIYTQFDGKFNTQVFLDKITWICFGAAFVGGFVFGITGKGKKNKLPDSKGKTASGEEFDLNYDAHYMKDSELKGGHGLINCTWSTLPSIKNTGLVVRQERKNGKYEITMKDEIHALVLGTTGSGKTSILIDPTIRILAHSGEKPSIVVSDPKGELYERHADVLRREGYEVEVYDLDNPFISSRWNPMERAYDLYQRAMRISSEAKKYSNCTPEAVGKKKLPGEVYGDTWFEFDGVAFPNEELLKIELASKRQQLINEATFDLRGIAASVCPIDPQTQDKTWEQGAQDYLYGIMLAMLEDSLDERLGSYKLRKDQFNFYNLYKIANKRDDDPDNPFGSVKKYCAGRAKTSDVSGLTSPVINNATNTTRSYMGVLSGKISALMQDMGICYATSGSDIDFKKMVDKPTIFFLKCPDHKKERHPLAVVCIAQMYRSLVDVANKIEGKKLPRHIYFLLDEFGNLPVIPDFATMITVARSRNICFEIVLQSYTQLDTKYGKDNSETLRTNLNAQIFLGTDDQATREAFSKSCGEIQLVRNEEQTSTSKSDKSEQGTQRSTSISVQRTTRPLISAYELSQLPFQTAIVKMFRSPPLKVKMDQFHKTPEFDKSKAEPIVGISKSLDEETVFFDIEKRNNLIFQRQNRWSDF